MGYLLLRQHVSALAQDHRQVSNYASEETKEDQECTNLFRNQGATSKFWAPNM